jgi:hypothetical protein
MRTYRLQNRANHLALDPDTGELWAAIGPAPLLEKVDLQTGATLLLPVPGPARKVAVGTHSTMFALADAGLYTDTREISSVDRSTGATLDAMPSEYEELVYAPGLQNIYTIDGSTGEIIAFNTSDRTLSSVIRKLGCSLMSLSPDEQHLITGCIWVSGANRAAESDTADLSRVVEWGDTCLTLPTFSPDGQWLYGITNRIIRYDVDTRVQGEEIAFAESKCVEGWGDDPNPIQLAVSSGGRFIYYVRHCAVGTTPEPLFWIDVTQ